MKRYATQAIPWTALLVAAALVFALMALVRLDPWTLWPLQGLAVGVLAGAAGWCLDEPAAAVVDAAPRGLAWRTGVRSAAVALLAAGWTVTVWWASPALFGHADVIAVQGLAALALGCGWVTWRRTRGEATPGHRWATTAVPLAGAWALLRPAAEHLPVFPYALGGPGGDWAASAGIWGVAGLAAAAAVAALLARDGRTPRLRRPPHHPRTTTD